MTNATPLDQTRRADLCRRILAPGGDGEAARELAALYRAAGHNAQARLIETCVADGRWHLIATHARQVVS